MKLKEMIAEKEALLEQQRSSVRETEGVLDTLHQLNSSTKQKSYYVKKANRSKKITVAVPHTKNYVARVRDLLLQTNRPMHLKEIVAGLGYDISDKGTTMSIAGSIAPYARKGKIFVKNSPATFALLQEERTTEDSSALTA